MSSPYLARVIDEAEARQLPAVIDEWWDAHDVRRWLARALRIDLALLTQRPDLVVPCLHRRCTWLGGPAEAAFYAQRPEVPRDAAALRELVAPWRPGRPWLRALRPPQIPLDGGVLEEYRTSLDGELRISADAETLAVVGDDDAIAWDRLTGRRVPGARARLLAPEATAPRWRLGSDSSWDRLVLEHDHRRIELPSDLDMDLWSSVWPLTGDLVIASSYSSHWLVNVQTARLAWTSSGRICDLRLSPDGHRLFRACRDLVEIVDLATGDRLAWWSVPEVRRLVLFPDGALATHSPGIVRVWDPALAGRSPVRLLTPDGWTAAQFSPDGSRLITGGLLCDGRTGAALAALDVDTGNWIEGGPPTGCQRLTDDGFIEAAPFGLQRWDSRDGSVIATHRDLRASAMDAVAFDPRGVHYAIAPYAHSSASAGRLLIFSLRSGEPLLELADVHLAQRGPGFALGFSPDGSQLWWETPDGSRWVLPLAAPTRPRQLTDDEPTPSEPDPLTIAIHDGLLTIGDAAIPCDDDLAVASPDGRSFASRTGHYALEDR